MKKEFVPYEVAIALKELGFDGECFAAYNEDKQLHRLRGIMEWATGKNSNLKAGSQLCHTPLLQQAFEWFRNEKKLAGMVEIGTQEFSFRIFDIAKDKTIDTNVLSFNGTYEEAELACLKRMIEIIKTR